MSELSSTSLRATRQSRKRALEVELHQPVVDVDQGQQDTLLELDIRTKQIRRKSIESHEKQESVERDADLLSREAMNNPLVLSKIAKGLPAKYLFNLRRTCNLWNQAFVPHLRRKHQPIAIGHWTYLNVGKHIQLHDFLSCFRYRINKSNELNPFQNYWIRLNNFVFERDVAALAYPANLSQVVPLAKVLQLLEFSKWNLSLDQLRDIIFTLTPKLTELTLTPSLYTASDLSPYPPNLSSGLKKKLPNLLRFRFRVPTSDWNISDPLCVLVMDIIESAHALELDLFIQTTGFLPPVLSVLKAPLLLTTLRIFSVGMQDLQFLTLWGTNLRLESLFLALMYNAWSSVPEWPSICKQLGEFLITQERTLRTLKLEFLDKHLGFGSNSLQPNFRIKLRMPHLTELTSFKVLISVAPLRLRVDLETELTNTFPKLQRVEGNAYFHVPLRHGIESANPKVTELKIESNAQDLFRVCSPIRFPAITRLSIEVDLEDKNDRHKVLELFELAKIVTAWPAVTTLSLSLCIDRPTLGIDLDLLLTGIGWDKLEKFKQELGKATVKHQLITLNSLHSWARQYKESTNSRNCSISDLRQLKILNLKVNDCYYNNSRYLQSPSKVTDLSVYLGFALMAPTLQRITLGGTINNQITEDGREFLRSVLWPWAVLEF